MEREGVKTPPILDWVVVSLPCSPSEAEDTYLPFETISAAVLQLEKLYLDDISLKREESFRLHKKHIEQVQIDPNPPIVKDDSLHGICNDVMRRMAEILREIDKKEDCLDLFFKFQGLDDILRKRNES
ncbi:unnamed protein product [Blepharisma stoltei]|uniref:Uncharacterized protein n=1 Tax=Blepharisma stoltei TaxID=1481888 RepID=A0AAU9KHN4_9CILI|nr:unnamed protein product [Blepharisma stoltei]